MTAPTSHTSTASEYFTTDPILLNPVVPAGEQLVFDLVFNLYERFFRITVSNFETGGIIFKSIKDDNVMLDFIENKYGILIPDSYREKIRVFEDLSGKSFSFEIDSYATNDTSPSRAQHWVQGLCFPGIPGHGPASVEFSITDMPYGPDESHPQYSYSSIILDGTMDDKELIDDIQKHLQDEIYEAKWEKDSARMTTFLERIQNVHRAYHA